MISHSKKDGRIRSTRQPQFTLIHSRRQVDQRAMEKGQDNVFGISGRGDRNVQSVADELPKLGPQSGWD